MLKILGSEPRDEEATRAMAVGTCQQELGSLRVSEGRPLVAERLRIEAARIDDRLVLVGVECADRVDDRPAFADALGCNPKEVALELREWPRAPAQVGAAREDAEARAGRVDEDSVEGAELGGKLERVRLHNGHARRAEAADVLLQLPRAARMDLDRDYLARENR